MSYLKQRVIPALATIHYLVFALAALVIMDGLMTHFIVGGGIAQEANPLMAPLVGGISFLILKIAGALICASILLDIYRRWAKLAVFSTACMVACYVAILSWNSYVYLSVA